MTKAHTALKLEEAVKVLEVADAGTFQSSQKTKPEAESRGRQRRTPGGALSSRDGNPKATTVPLFFFFKDIIINFTS